MEHSFAISILRKTCSTVCLLLLSYCMYAQPSYCTSDLGGYAGDIPIDSVAIVGTTLNNYTPSNPYTYSAYPISGTTTATLQQGLTYTIAVSTGAFAYYGGNIAMWIDFNQNGTFDTYEWVSIGTDVIGETTATFTVPATAHTGVTGLRIRTRDASEGSVYAYDACTNYYSGEAEDYYVTIDTTVPCAGTPAAAAISGPSSLCYGTGYTLTVSGYTFTTGLTYQWKSAPSGTGVFTNIAGATGTSYTSGGLCAATDYQLVVTCTASGLSSTSSIFTVALNPAYACYCHDSTSLGGGSTFYEQIDSVSIVGTTLNNYTPSNLATYSSYPYSGSTTAALQQGGTYTIAVQTGPFESSAVGMWIDYNQNGSFDADEFASIGAGVGTGNQVGTFTVPFTALTGETGMRIRNTSSGLYGADACSFLFDGETEDYFVTIDTTYPCAGVPVAGTISGKDSACSADSFVLTTAGTTLAGGLTYQWLSRPSGAGTFTPVAGATNATFTAYGISGNTDFKVVVTCTSSALSSTSAVYTVYQLPFYRCYCDSASLGGSSAYLILDSVAIEGTSLNNYTPSNFAPYTSYPPAGSTTASLQQGGSYTIVVNSGNYPFGVSAAVGIWIDYDHSGTFEPSEYSLVGIGSTGDQSATFTVPFTALTGKTGMRVRNTLDYIDATYACTFLTDGETEDYVLTIDTTYPCAGTPVAGLVSAPDSVCSSMAFTVTASGYSVASGLSFQWLSRPAGVGPFTSVTGATDPSLSIFGQAAATDYELKVTCIASGLSATSAAITVGELPFFECYCDSAALGGSIYYGTIDSVAIGGTTLNNYTPYLSSTYAVFPASGSTTATLQQCNFYNIYVNANGGFYTGYPNDVALWIDYDHSGTFDASEWTNVGTNIYGIAAASFYVPLTALTGTTGMRVRNISTEFYESMGAYDACTMYSSGMTQDYVISIDTALPCTGTPLAGTISGATNICPNDTFMLSLVSFSSAAGIRFQWESRPSGSSSFTAIPGATMPFYTISGISSATDFRATVTCTGSGSSAQTPVFTVNVNPFNTCYCSPSNGTVLVSYQGENEMARAVISGTTFNDGSIYVPYTTGYVQVSPSISSHTAILKTDSAYNFTVFIDSMAYYPAMVQGWIDFDHSGTYDASEYIPFMQDYTGGAFTASFYVPSTAMSGQTGMRIESSDYYFAGDACTDIYNGEVADFTVTIDSANTAVPILSNTSFSVKAYPNPVSSQVTVQTYGLPGNGATIILSDVTGRVIKTVGAAAEKTVVAMDGLASGIYLIKYEDDQHTSVIKVTKQ